MLLPVLGTFASLTAHSAVRYPVAHLTDDTGALLGTTAPSTSPDQLAVVGTLTSGVFATSNPGGRSSVEISGEDGSRKRCWGHPWS